MKRGSDRGKTLANALLKNAMMKLAKLSNTTILVLWKLTKSIQQIEGHLFKKNS